MQEAEELARSWSTSWSVALGIALAAARREGYRYIVRRSYGRPERWLVMRRLPLQHCDRVPRVGGR